MKKYLEYLPTPNMISVLMVFVFLGFTYWSTLENRLTVKILLCASVLIIFFLSHVDFYYASLLKKEAKEYKIKDHNLVDFNKTIESELLSIQIELGQSYKNGVTYPEAQQFLSIANVEFRQAHRNGSVDLKRAAAKVLFWTLLNMKFYEPVINNITQTKSKDYSLN